MITLTTEQAQQIEEVLMMLAEKRMDLGLFLKALESIRAARVQGECATLDAHWVSEEELPSFNAWLNLFVESRIMEDRAARAQKQAEQEPVAVVEITYGREPECYVTGNIDDFPEGVFKLYTAPVRQVDLTDDEIAALFQFDDYDFARAVIAADRRKNK